MKVSEAWRRRLRDSTSSSGFGKWEGGGGLIQLRISSSCVRGMNPSTGCSPPPPELGHRQWSDEARSKARSHAAGPAVIYTENTEGLNTDRTEGLNRELVRMMHVR